MPATLQIYLFGGFRLAVDDKDLPSIATVRARSLFAYLVMHAERDHTRDLLAGLFWPDLSDTTARRRLSQALWRIGQAFSAGGVENPLLIEADAIRFDNCTTYWLDVEAFEAAVDETEKENGPGESASSRLFVTAYDFNRRMSGREIEHGPERETTGGGRQESWLKDGVKLYCGDFMAGYYDDWIIPERERLREHHLSALEHLLAQCKDSGDYEQALRFAHRLTVAEPLRETAHCEIMQLCSLLDRPQEALHQYEILKGILETELGIEPSPTASMLHLQLVAGAENPPPSTASTRVYTSPFLDTTFSIPLVGRKTEREKLAVCIDAAMNGNGGIVLVGGEAGVGKTRLLQEIARDAGWRGMQVLWGWGKDRTSVSAYDILGQILQAGVTPLRAAQLEPLVDCATRSALAVFLPNLASLWPNLPALSSGNPRQKQKRVHESFTRVVLSLGEITPHLLILEDVHWATETDLAALLHLARSLANSSVLVIISFREGEAQERPAIWKMLQKLNEVDRHERFELARLTDSETDDLVHLGLGLHQPAPRFTQRVYEETDGNPLFVLETLRALHDEGVLYRDESGTWNTPWDRTTANYAELPVPPEVRQVIANRLERLDCTERAILNAAAIMGDRFDFLLLSRLIEQEQKVCTKCLASLVSRRFLEEEPNAYRFSHNLARQIVIMEMSADEKRRRHRALVAVLEAIHPNQVETLAHHAMHGEIWERAFVYNQRAGDRARAMYAGDKAIEFYTHAMDAWRNLGYRPNRGYLALLQKRGEIFQETGQFDLAEDDFQHAVELATQMNITQAHAEASNSLSYLHFQRGDYASALEISIQAHEMARLAGSEVLVARALLNSANALRNMGRCTEAIDFYHRAVSALEHTNDQVRLADCLNRLGYAYIFTGQLTEAEEVMQRGLAMRRRLDEKVGLAYSLSNLSGLYLYRGDFPLSAEVTQEAYDVATASGDPYGQDAALQNLGCVKLEQGLLDEAIAYFERALAIGREIGDKPLVAEALADLGQAYAKKGDLLAARTLQQESIVAFEDGGEVWYLCKAHEYLSEISLALGDSDVALEQARRALAVAQELDTPYLLGSAHRALAQVLAHDAANNTDADPVYHFEASIQLLQSGGFRASLARSLAAFGRYLNAAGDDEHLQRGTEMLARAKDLFRELGMAWDLATLERDEAGHTQPDRLLVRLPLTLAPVGRPLRADEWVDVIWSISTSEDEVIQDKVARRQHRLLRLLREADKQGAAPRVDDLARALDVSPKTIKRDLVALRAGGHNARTRGSRG